MNNYLFIYFYLVFCRFAYIDFGERGAFNKAVKLNGSDINGSLITVKEARPKEYVVGSGPSEKRFGFDGGKGRGKGWFNGGKKGSGDRDGERSGLGRVVDIVNQV